MVNPEFTYIYCHDEKRTFSVEVKKRFNDTDRYEVLVSSGRHELLSLAGKHRLALGFRVALIPLSGAADQIDQVKNLIDELRAISPGIQIILIVSGESPEEIVARSGIRPYSWVPVSNNSVLRIHNSVKKLISEATLTKKTRRVKIAFRILMGFAVAALLLLVYARLRFPQYF